ncbi:MAG: AhpA/YtjB family protein [Lonepinella koalarum]|nr:AhpA/YtjB family protein [Lonepinella koalarum]
MPFVKQKMLKSGLLLLIIALSVITLLVILFGLKQFQHSSQLATYTQVTNLSHLFVRQQTNLFAILLANNTKAEKLSENLDHLIQDNFILDAGLYAKNGELLAQSSKPLNLRQQLGLIDETPSLHRQIVEPVYTKNGIEGFLRITFDANYGKIAEKQTSALFHQLYANVAIVFLLGILLASSIHYFLNRYRRLNGLKGDNQQINLPENRSHSLNFHRRRKRFK